MSSNKGIREEWKDIKGYEGLYQVSNTGKVRSLDRIVKDKTRERYQKLKGIELQTTDNGRGYKLVFLTKNSKRENKYVHRLVAESFLTNINNLPEVNHKNLNKSDNSVTNLEWIDSTENKRHYQKTEIAKQNNKTKGIESRNRYIETIKDKIPYIINEYNNNKTISYINKQTKIGQSTISRILKEQNIKIRGKVNNRIIIQKDLKGEYIHAFKNYNEIIEYIRKNKLSKAKSTTIKKEIYDAITLRRGNNKKYGFIWEKGI